MEHPTVDPSLLRRSGPLTDSVLSALSEALRGVRYGTVTVIIQDGRVVQIDRTERKRLKADSE